MIHFHFQIFQIIFFVDFFHDSNLFSYLLIGLIFAMLRERSIYFHRPNHYLCAFSCPIKCSLVNGKAILVLFGLNASKEM